MARPRAPGNATWRSTPLARPAPDEAEKSERSDARGANTMVAATIIMALTVAAVVLVL